MVYLTTDFWTAHKKEHQTFKDFLNFIWSMPGLSYEQTKEIEESFFTYCTARNELEDHYHAIK